jgi:hypothetical protein
MLIALAALLATSFSLPAEEAKGSKAEQPYTEQLGDNQVTSVKRDIRSGFKEEPGLTQEELVRAAEEGVTISVSPDDPTTDTKPGDQR